MERLVVDLPTAGEWSDLSGHDLDAKLRELNIAARRVEAAMVGAVDHAERSGHYAADGHRTVGAWVMATTNCTRGEATARTRTARMVRELAEVAGEFMAGRIGVAQVRELARLHANPRAGDQLAGSQDILLEAAQTLEFADFKIVAARWEQLADADGAHAEHERAHEYRNARVGFDGATTRFETTHGVVQGTAMRDVFQTFCDAEFERDWQWTRDTYGDDATPSQMPRTAAQRRADAFVAMVLAAAEAGTGDGRSIDATVNLVCDLDQYEQRLESEITDEPVDVDPSTVRERRCETIDGIPVDPRQVVAATVLGRLRLIVTDDAGVIVHAGRARTLFTGPIREAMMALDPMCNWLGCTLRAQICDIDHLEPRSRGGPTDPSNGGTMCHRHNVFKHTGGFAVARRPDGTIHITRPDGTPLRPPDAA